jgi:hypothetical protein
MKTLTLTRSTLAVLGMAISITQAAEMRTWMSRKGGTLEAELGSINGGDVVLITKEAKELKLKVDDLSLADRQHLVEFGGADKSIISSGEPGFPEKEVRIDSGTIKKLTNKMTLGEDSTLIFELVESQHFLVATAGKIRGNDTAETAERLWHGMAFQHMNFRKDWGTKRMLILMVEDRAVFKALGEWYVKQVGDRGPRVAATWDKAGSTQIGVPDPKQKELNLHPSAVVFNIEDDSKYKTPLDSFPTHCIASALLSKQMSGVSDFGGEGYFAIVTGHSYFKEISLTKKTETQLLDVSGYADNEVSSKSGFEDGTSWARTLRTMVRKDQDKAPEKMKVKVLLEPMLKLTGADLTPETLVLMYSFACYMETDAKRLCAFAKMIRQVETSNQIPPAIEIAKFFGFTTVAEFEADWKKFILEGPFK